MSEGTKKRGFGSMLPTKQREIARLGGQAAHKKGTAHVWTPFFYHLQCLNDKRRKRATQIAPWRPEAGL